MRDMLEDKVSLVTGGSSGIGRATALVFAREGARVVVSDLAVATGEETVEMIKKAGGEAIFVRVDVTKEPEVAALIKEIVKTYGRLDCAFNNAGVWSEDWDQVINVNLNGVWLCVKHEIPQMLEQGGGAIVNTSSMAGLVGMPSPIPAYDASKHGIVGLTKAIALAYAKNNIRVNTVCPGPIPTPLTEKIMAREPKGAQSADAMIPMGRLGKPSEVAEAVVWLCSDAASFVTGLAMAVDGGYTAQ